MYTSASNPLDCNTKKTCVISLYDNRCKVSASIGELSRKTNTFFSFPCRQTPGVLNDCGTRRQNKRDAKIQTCFSGLVCSVAKLT